MCLCAHKKKVGCVPCVCVHCICMLLPTRFTDMCYQAHVFTCTTASDWELSDLGARSLGAITHASPFAV